MIDCLQRKRSCLHEEYFRQHKELEIKNTNQNNKNNNNDDNDNNKMSSNNKNNAKNKNKKSNAKSEKGKKKSKDTGGGDSNNTILFEKIGSGSTLTHSTNSQLSQSHTSDHISGAMGPRCATQDSQDRQDTQGARRDSKDAKDTGSDLFLNQEKHNINYIL